MDSGDGAPDGSSSARQAAPWEVNALEGMPTHAQFGGVIPRGSRGAIAGPDAPQLSLPSDSRSHEESPVTLADELADIFTAKRQKSEQLEAVKHERDAVDAQEEEFMRRRGKKPARSGQKKSGD